MSGEHTPGPWVPVEMAIGSRSFWVPISRDGRLPETEANARLIAAAPDLMETLRFIVDRENLMFAECSDAEDIISRAKAAIAKAEGHALPLHEGSGE